MKIFAVGMNYLQHNKELDGTLYKPDAPVIFTKADSALLKVFASFPAFKSPSYAKPPVSAPSPIMAMTFPSMP